MVITQKGEVGTSILQPSHHCYTCITIQQETKSSEAKLMRVLQIEGVDARDLGQIYLAVVQSV